jgi:hypothetical protein
MQTKVVERTEQDLAGYIMPDGKKLYAHKITVEGVVYNYDSKSPELTAFEAGKEATFTTEEKPQKNGKMRLKIKPAEDPAKRQFPAGGGFQGGSKYPAKDDAQIAMMSCLSSAATHSQGTSRPWPEVLKNAGEAYEIVKSKKGDFK